MISLIKKKPWKYKNNKFWYYFINFLRQFIPKVIFRLIRTNKLKTLKHFDIDYMRYRINYYNKLNEHIHLSDKVKPLSTFRLKRKLKTYFFDTDEYSRYFGSNLKLSYRFGDITYVPEEPSIVKSRPIGQANANSIILKLNKIRHFTFTNDKKDFRKKKDMLVGRMNANQPHRIKFLEMYINHPLCNVGKINDNNKNQNLLVKKLTIEEQLEYKFILCIEGHDVASSLKWVMSSHSLAVSTKLKHETWFMEGTLIPNYHFVLIKDDFSDLEERMNYYIQNPIAALEIIKNANEYIEQFKNKKREDLLSLLVLEKYFHKTGQLDINETLKLLFTSNNTI